MCVRACVHVRVLRHVLYTYSEMQRGCTHIHILMYDTQVASLKLPSARQKLFYTSTGGARSVVSDICKKGFVRAIWHRGPFGPGVYLSGADGPLDVEALAKNMEAPRIYDGRRVLDLASLEEAGWQCYAVGRPSNG